MTDTLLHVVVPVLMAFIFTGMAVYFLAEYFTRDTSDTLKDRLDNITGSFKREDLTGQRKFEPVPDIIVSAPAGRAGPAAFNPALASAMATTERPDLVPMLTNLLSASELNKVLRNELSRAGLKLRPAEFLAMCAASAIVMFIIAYALFNNIGVGVFLAISAAVIPLIVLRVKQGARRAKFDAQLPDVLILVASSLRTGYSFMHSTQLVIEEMPPPMSEEFAWVLGEATLGVPMETALTRLVDRVKSYDLDLVVTAINIQLQVGGNLAEIMDTIAETIRERMRIRQEISSLTAEGKLSGIILFLMPLVLGAFLFAKSPTYFDPLLHDPDGRWIIGGTIVLQLLGGATIKKMVSIDV